MSEETKANESKVAGKIEAAEKTIVPTADDPKAIAPPKPKEPKYVMYDIGALNQSLNLLGNRCKYAEVKDVIDFFSNGGVPVQCDCYDKTQEEKNV